MYGVPLGKASRVKVDVHSGNVSNICDWVPLDSVVKYRGQHVLNGLFGVEKSGKVASGKPVLRLIMNLVGSNSIMRQFTGAVHNLPSITAWMSIFADEHEYIKMWQSDMSNAFYLFRIPDVWKPFLAFNVLREESNSHGDVCRVMALACKVLPMGWLSSVSIMQEISERILNMKQLDPLSQLVRTKAAPQWMVGIFHAAREQCRLWWHVYLDNFALGHVVSHEDDLAAGHTVHETAEIAWAEAGVLSSEKKRKSGVSAAHELGAFIDGEAHYLGGSPERLLRLAHATFWILQQPLLTKKLVQVVAGRWVHVMQFRRPSMAILEKTWDFVGKTTWQQGIHVMVRRELFQCLLSIPLLHTHLGAKMSPIITASDASSIGGAVGVAKNLTDIGAAYTSACLVNHNLPQQVPIMVISLFGGIGGAFRVYDILGLQPVALIHFDIHKPANRVISRRWPHAEIHEDVRTFSKELFRDLLAKYLNIEEIHIWAGFPCVDLSAAKAYGLGLMGPASSLFFEILRIRKIVREEAGGHITCKLTVENVASMKREEAQAISRHLDLEPYFFDCVDSVPMHRPRLCWTTEYLENTFDDINIWPTEHWRHVQAAAPYPEQAQWREPGSTWPGGDRGAVLPTAMKAIVRAQPPVRPAGIEKCDSATLQRYAADSFRYPPYQYKEDYIFYTQTGKWRTISAEEKELLLGYGWKHTALCLSASEIKQSYQKYDDLRHSLLGDSFSMFFFVIAAAAMSRQFLPRVSYKWLCKRMGMAPGFRSNLRLPCPLERKLVYGTEPQKPVESLQTLNQLLLSRTNHTGSDVRITTGEVLNPKAHPRQSVEADWYHWQPCFSTRWKQVEHINVLELRSIFLAVQYNTMFHIWGPPLSELLTSVTLMYACLWLARDELAVGNWVECSVASMLFFLHMA
jgi:site-specific DNA-cytosine methylase